MLESLNPLFKLLSHSPATTQKEISKLKKAFPNMPTEYVDLMQEATEIELKSRDGQYMRIWAPSGCLEMDAGYEISSRINGAIPIGDDGGGRVIFYMDGEQGHGLYYDDYGNLNRADAVFIGPSLRALLQEATGLKAF